MQSPPDTMPRLVAVVVTYNRLEKLKATVARLLESPADELAALVVIDNAATDGTGAWLATLEDPRLAVQTQPVNLGGAGGFEAGMRHAVAAFDPDWVVVMDDDARPAPGALAAFHALDKTGWAALAAAVHFPDGTICEMNRPSRNPFWDRRRFWATARAGRDGFHIPPSAYDGPGLRIDVTSFVGLFVSRATIGKVGYPDGGLFLYAEDAIYTLGISAAGGVIRFAPQVRFEHDCAPFAGAGAAAFVPLWKTYYYHRNLLILYRQAAGRWFPLAFAVFAPKWLMKARAHPGRRRAFLGLMLRAIRDGLAGRTRVDHARIVALATGSGCPGDSGPAAPARRTGTEG